MVNLDVSSSRNVLALFEAIEACERAIASYSDNKSGPVYLVDKYASNREFQIPRLKMVQIMYEMIEEYDKSLNSYGITREKRQIT